MKKIILGVATLIAFASCQNEMDESQKNGLSEEKEFIDLGKVETDTTEEVLAVIDAKDLGTKSSLKSTYGLYYADLKVLSSSSSNVPEIVNSNNDNYFVWKIDLNEGAAGKFIYFYLSRTDDASKAVTYLRADHDKVSWPTSRVVTGYEAVTNFNGGWVDLNEGAKGKFVYLSQSKRHNANDKPITSLLLTRSSKKKSATVTYENGKKYYAVGSNNLFIDNGQISNLVELNMDTKTHKKYIYLYYAKD